jgi:hypothetical protein
MSQLTPAFLERRIFRLGAYLLLAGGALTWLFFDAKTAISLLAGGALAALNMAWLRRTVRAVTLDDAKTSKRRILAGFFLRLLLIPLCLYAIMHFFFPGIIAATAGFVVFSSGILIEGIFESAKSSPK